MVNLFFKYFTPTLVILISCISYYNAEYKNQTRWRGGGFGMYSEICWDMNEVWFDNIPDSLNFTEIYRQECNKIRMKPSTKNMNYVGELIRDNYSLHNFTIEMWKLNYNLNENKLFNVKVKESYVQ
jgi:hypothetical protein